MKNERLSELIEEVQWLADIEQVKEAWTKEKSSSDCGYDSPEYYSVLYDDLKILDAESLEGLSECKKIIVSEFARALKKAAEKDRALYDIRRLIEDPHFKIAQKIASLL